MLVSSAWKESGENSAMECFAATTEKYIHVVPEEGKDKRVAFVHEDEIGSVRVISLSY